MSNEAARNVDFPYEINSVDEKTSKELLEHFTGQRRSYVQVGPEKYIYPMEYAKKAHDYYNSEVKSDDIWIVTIPRSGTTLTQELVWLIGNDLNYKQALNQPLIQRFPFFEFGLLTHDDVYNEILQENAQSEENKTTVETIFAEGRKVLHEMKSQRYIKTHFPFSLLPRDWAYKKCKTIYVARNPKNVAISYFHFSKLFRMLDYCGDFVKFWNYFEKDLLPWLPYWSHIKEAWKMRNEPHILFLFYEDIIRDMPGTIDKVAQFLGKTLTDHQKTELETHLSFENFQKNASVNFEHLRDLRITNAHVPGFIRQGNKPKEETKLPIYLGCPREHDIETAKEAFKKICYKNATIVTVERYVANTRPACCWRVYYQMKSEQALQESEENFNNVRPSDLPQDEALLRDFFEDLTGIAHLLNLNVVPRKMKTENTAVVDYYPRACECPVENF